VHFTPGEEKRISNTLLTTVLQRRMGRYAETGTSQKTCQILSIIQGFRVKGKECKMPAQAGNLYFGSVFIFSEGSFN
jgi:hypothetical protein